MLKVEVNISVAIIIAIISIIIGYLIPIPSPMEINEEKIKTGSINLAPIKKEVIDYEMLDEIFKFDIERFSQIQE